MNRKINRALRFGAKLVISACALIIANGIIADSLQADWITNITSGIRTDVQQGGSDMAFVVVIVAGLMYAFIGRMAALVTACLGAAFMIGVGPLLTWVQHFMQ